METCFCFVRLLYSFLSLCLFQWICKNWNNIANFEELAGEMAATLGLSLKMVLQKSFPRLECVFKPRLYSRRIHSSVTFCNKEPNQLIVRPPGFNLPEEEKNKETFLEAVKIYTNRPGPRRGQVEFILSALKYMEEFGVHRDLQAYKDLLDIMPKAIYIPTNMFQAELMHYPKVSSVILLYII